MRISDWSSDVCSSDLDSSSAIMPPSEEVTQRLDRLSAASTPRFEPVRGPMQTVKIYPHGVARNRLLQAVTRLGVPAVIVKDRSEERSVGKEWVRTCRTRWTAYH